MGLTEIKAKITKHPVKAIIFRENLGVITDYAGRKGKEKYHLMKLGNILTAPPSTEYFYMINGRPTIFLYCPRLGTHYYMKMPKTSFNPENNTMDVKYVVRSKDKATGDLIEGDFKTEKVTVKTKNTSNKAEKEEIKEITTTFELFDHDDLNFLASETQRSESKYEKKENWLEKNMPMLLNIVFMVGMAIALYITYEQIVFPAAEHAITHYVQCIASNSTI